MCKRIVSVVLILAMLCALSGCGLFHQSVADRFSKQIEEYEAKVGWRADKLHIGETDRASGAGWTDINFMNMIHTTSTDESVVTVDSKGMVTAVGEGQAYVIIYIEMFGIVVKAKVSSYIVVE